jgi:hypothetical protein
LDLAQNSNVQDAFVIAVEQQARERLERLSALKRIKPVDMTKLSQQVSPVYLPEVVSDFPQSTPCAPDGNTVAILHRDMHCSGLCRSPHTRLVDPNGIIDVNWFKEFD